MVAPLQIYDGYGSMAEFLDETAEQVSAQLRDRGLRLLYDGARRGTAGSKVNFVHPKDAGGVLVELVEHPTGESS